MLLTTMMGMKRPKQVRVDQSQKSVREDVLDAPFSRHVSPGVRMYAAFMTLSNLRLSSVHGAHLASSKNYSRLLLNAILCYNTL
jgi:hypothetical protein